MLNIAENISKTTINNEAIEIAIADINKATDTIENTNSPNG